MKEHLHEAYSFVFEDDLLREIEESGLYKEIKENEKIIEIGDYVKNMPLLLNGAIKILREDQNGEELLLYFIERGDTCAMTLSCCLGHTKSGIRAVAEKDSSLILIPIEKMEEWMTNYRSWRSFVLESYQSRLSEMLDTIDTLAFMNMDQRLMRYLQDKAKVNQNEMLNITHRQVSKDMHTSRVVVSRILKKLENEEKIKLQRNFILVKDL